MTYLTPGQEALLAGLNHYLALATLIGCVMVVIWAIKLVMLHRGASASYRSRFERFAQYALPLGFFATLFSTVVSLIYSDYLGVLPCGLCWFQRIFIYGMVVLFGVAWYKKDTSVVTYVLPFSYIGLVIALYHQYLQMGYSPLIPCPAIASMVNCDKPTFMEYGFITFPMMSVVLFAITILLSVTIKMTATKR